jgi:hypothetical protein
MYDLVKISVLTIVFGILFFVYLMARERASRHYRRVIELQKELRSREHSVSECFQTLIKIDRIKKKFLYKVFYVYL